LVVLDAGKGYKKYIWFPSNDSTQWIEVRRVGNYFVVVDDYRGCKGKDEAQVDDRCNLRVFIPNAFTPNGDGLNDRLHIYVEHATGFETSIYNAWGELVFKGDAAHEWDGTYKGNNVPQGVYLVKVNAVGFLNKFGVEQSFQVGLLVLY
jgi:gliding motility-associated-like protein